MNYTQLTSMFQLKLTESVSESRAVDGWMDGLSYLF